MTKPLELDTILRRAMQQDQGIAYALAYGSLTQGTGDEFSDVEYYLYVADPAALDPETWLNTALAGSEFRVLHHVVNEFGTPNFILNGLIRAELHIQSIEKMPEVLGWPNCHIYPEQMLIKDPDGQLQTLLQALQRQQQPDPMLEAQAIADRTLNWLVFGSNVLARGEQIRALELLGWVQGGLLRLARLAERNTTQWFNASRRAEWELSAGALARYDATTGGIYALAPAYAAALVWLSELAPLLGLPLNAEIVEALAARFSAAPPSSTDR